MGIVEAMSEMPSHDRQLSIAQLHGIEWMPDFEYATVWRQAKADDRFDLADPPDGEGWEVNVDKGEQGAEVTVPRWSDGTVVHQKMYWRRESKGMEPWRPAANRSEKRP